MLAGVLALLRDLRRLPHDLLGLLLRRPVLGAAAVALDSAGRVVLIRRRDTGTWGLPGGVVAYGERLAETLARELSEETGYALIEVKRLVGAYSAPDRDPRAHSVLVVAECQVAEPPGGARPSPLEVREVRAFDRDALPSPLAHDGARILADWLAARPAVLD
jgi:ADP-ribose pyrophosphatase YjhB (NUDIX family)